MANDRIFITCRNCGKQILFAKYYPTIGHGIWHPDYVDEFVWTHMQCSPHFGKGHLHNDRCFDLITESELYKYDEIDRQVEEEFRQKKLKDG